MDKKVVRNIPIYIEGRDEPLINKDHDHNAQSAQSSSFQGFPQNFYEGEKFNDPPRARSHPSQAQPQSSSSASSAPHVAQKTSSAENVKETQQQIETQEEAAALRAIQAIESIQKIVLDLMQRIEAYNGESHKEYLFLDEMLTQNLIKLDNLDVEGKENVKSARREAIRCINHLIASLEEKNEEFKKSKEQAM